MAQSSSLHWLNKFDSHCDDDNAELGVKFIIILLLLNQNIGHYVGQMP